MNSRPSNNAINEQLSAFLDGELSQEELPLLLRQLEKQPELLAEAQRLQQTHLCVLGEQPVQALLQAKSFCKNIHDAIANEEKFNSDMDFETRSTHSQVAVSKSSLKPSFAASKISNQNHTEAANDGFWKGFAGAGISAAVAMLAINLWQAPTDVSMSTEVLSAEAVPEQVAETYTVPKYVAPSETDSTTFFLEPGDLQTVSMGNYRTEQSRRNALESFNIDYSEQLLNNRMVLMRMRQAENAYIQLSQENNRLRQQLEAQKQLLEMNGLSLTN